MFPRRMSLPYLVTFVIPHVRNVPRVHISLSLSVRRSNFLVGKLLERSYWKVGEKIGESPRPGTVLSSFSVVASNTAGICSSLVHGEKKHRSGYKNYTILLSEYTTIPIATLYGPGSKESVVIFITTLRPCTSAHSP